MIGAQGASALLTHHAFGQLATLSKAPANYLRTLPATLAAQNLNHGLKVMGDERSDEARLLLDTGLNTVRCITTAV